MNCREKEITTLRIYRSGLFHHTVIEICFEMLKSSEHEKSWRYSNSISPNFCDCSEIESVDPPISFYYWILRIEGPEWIHPKDSIRFNSQE